MTDNHLDLGVVRRPLKMVELASILGLLNTTLFGMQSQPLLIFSFLYQCPHGL